MLVFHGFLLDVHRASPDQNGQATGQADRATQNLSMGTTALVISASQVECWDVTRLHGTDTCVNLIL